MTDAVSEAGWVETWPLLGWGDLGRVELAGTDLLRLERPGLVATAQPPLRRRKGPQARDLRDARDELRLETSCSGSRHVGQASARIHPRSISKGELFPGIPGGSAMFATTAKLVLLEQSFLLVLPTCSLQFVAAELAESYASCWPRPDRASS